MSVLLAVDTSTSLGSVALMREGAVIAEQTWSMQRGHDAAVFASIERLLALTGQTVKDVDRVAVAVGPGSFTGVRIAIATAQGIARGSGARAVGVSTLDVIAQPWSTGGVRVCAVLPAGRDELCAALYREKHGTWSRASTLLVGTAADIARSAAAGALFAGEIGLPARATIAAELGSRAAFAPAGTTRRAGDLAAIAWHLFESGKSEAVESLEPVYVRPPAIRGRQGELLAAPAAAGTLPGAL